MVEWRKCAFAEPTNDVAQEQCSFQLANLAYLQRQEGDLEPAQATLTEALEWQRKVQVLT